MTTKTKTAILELDSKLTEKEQKNKAAEWLLSPEVSSAAVTEAFSKNYTGEDVTFNHMIDACKKATRQLTQDNSLEHAERLLMSQSIALNNLFVSLARKASSQEYVKQYETFLRLALKAQSQCRATLETLAVVKNPPVVYAKTANIAQNQQINNGAPPTQHTQPSTQTQATLTNDQGESQSTPMNTKQRVTA